MTQDKDLKKQARARMARTGKSHTAARAHANATGPEHERKGTLNRFEQAVIGLTIQAAGDVVAVYDGVDKWLCPSSEFEQIERDMRDQPGFEVDDRTDFHDASVNAYDDFCGRFKTVATVVGSNRGQWFPLVTAAIEGDLILEEDAEAYGAPPSTGGETGRTRTTSTAPRQRSRT